MIAEIHNDGPGPKYGKSYTQSLKEHMANALFQSLADGKFDEHAEEAATLLFNDLVPILRQIAEDPQNVSYVAQANEHIQQILQLTNHDEKWKARIHKVVNQILPNAP